MPKESPAANLALPPSIQTALTSLEGVLKEQELQRAYDIAWEEIAKHDSHELVDLEELLKVNKEEVASSLLSTRKTEKGNTIAQSTDTILHHSRSSRRRFMHVLMGGSLAGIGALAGAAYILNNREKKEAAASWPPQTLHLHPDLLLPDLSNNSFNIRLRSGHLLVETMGRGKTDGQPRRIQIIFSPDPAKQQGKGGYFAVCERLHADDPLGGMYIEDDLDGSAEHFPIGTPDAVIYATDVEHIFLYVGAIDMTSVTENVRFPEGDSLNGFPAHEVLRIDPSAYGAAKNNNAQELKAMITDDLVNRFLQVHVRKAQDARRQH